MSIEQSAVQFGTSRIEYRIERSARRKTVSIAIEPSGQVVLTAPPQAERARLDDLVRQKGRWILEHQRRLEDLEPPPPPRQYVSGESYLYLGRQYRLKVEVGEVTMPRVKAGGGRLVVDIPAGYPGGPRPELVRRLLTAWYARHARERLTERVAYWSGCLELPLPKVLIREPEKRWGSCDAEGTLRFNWRLMQAPLRLIDYVVAHETVHRVCPDHTEEFWATLGRVMPDYEGRREELRRLGARLGW